MSAQLTLRTVTVQNKDPQLKLTTETIAVPDGITLYHGQPITEAIPLSNRQQAPAKPVFAVHADDQVTPVETAYDLFEKLLITEGDYATPSEMLDEWICWWFNTFTDIKLVDYPIFRTPNEPMRTFRKSRRISRSLVA